MEEQNRQPVRPAEKAEAKPTAKTAAKAGEKKLSPAVIKKKRIRRRNLTRNIIQLIFFISMPGAFVAGFNGVKYLFQWVGAGEVLQANSFVKSLLALGIFTILFGRYFCGYVCSFGTLGDLVSWLSGLFQKKVLKKKKKYTLPVRLQKVLQKLKYINLAFIVTLSGFGIYSRLRGTSAWDVFSRLTSLKLPAAGYGIGIFCLLLVIAGMTVQERFFCQFLCPMGAVFAILPVLPTGSLHRNTPNCIKNCNACANQCPVSLKLAEDGTGGGECISCEKCVPTCPKGNISHIEDHLLPADGIAVIIKAVVFFLMGCIMGWCRFF